MNMLVPKNENVEQFEKSILSKLLNEFSPLEIAGIVNSITKTSVEFLQKICQEKEEQIQNDRDNLHHLISKVKSLSSIETLKNKEPEPKMDSSVPFYNHRSEPSSY